MKRRLKIPLRLKFLGALLFDRPVEELTRAMALATADVTLTLQGKNHLGEAPAALVAELGLQDRVRILDPCPPGAIVETAASYDVGVVALRGENENERRASTSKLFTCMAAGLAILGSDLPGIARVVGRHTNGLLVGGMRPADWAAAIDALAAMSDTAIDSMKQRSLDAARLYAWEKQTPAFLGEFLRALGQGDREAAVEE
jgi:glycosyltransferase involved in cell wall biosynthesis